MQPIVSCLLLAIFAQTAGIKTFEGETLQGIDHQGPLKVVNCRVQNETLIYGTLDALNSTFRTLEIIGKANIKNCTISGQVLVQGYLEAAGSSFQSPMQLQTLRLVLRDSHTTDIQMDDNGSYNQFGTINLYNTAVNGNITFTSGNGQVKLNGSSKVTGAISGGTTTH